MACLDEETILAFVQRALPAPASAAVVSHINGCAACRELVAEAATAFFEEHPPPADPESSVARTSAADSEFLVPGTKVSHYMIVDLIGVGAAGNVYRAHDPRLHRDVALKTIAPYRAAAPDTAPDAGEAQAMAQLSHPNVVGVHDTGIVEGQIFVVMELVEGDTVSTWLNEQPRSWREVLAVFMEAGRGLAAAHAVNVVHGDFKPENILMGTDGRVRVTDFGLAIMTGTSGSRAATGEILPLRISGTPAYMAPEQFQGQRATKPADQFSYCVAFYRALHQQHPFLPTPPAGGGVRDFMDAALAGKLTAPPAGSPVPAWLFDVLGKGLAVRPEDRFSSMDALLGQIEHGSARDTARALWRKWIVRAALFLAIAAVASIAIWWRASPPRPICGNGKVEPGEGCDDGNRSDDDGCLSSCHFATCGDGKLRAGVEECDDGNLVSGDECGSQCLHRDRGNGPSMLSRDGHGLWRNDTPMTWQRALETCKEAGAYLVTPRDFDNITDVLTRLLSGTSQPYWLGLSGSQKGEIVSVGGVRLASHVARALGPDPWAPGDCAIQSSPATWARASCDREFGFLCEKDPWLIDPRTNHAYRVLFSEMTWDGARRLCERFGAHLATMADTNDFLFLQKSFSSTAWIGARRTKKDAGFAWITGGPFLQELFANGEPNVAADESCVVLTVDHAIVDRTCDGRQAGPYGVLCQID